MVADKQFVPPPRAFGWVDLAVLGLLAAFIYALVDLAVHERMAHDFENYRRSSRQEGEAYGAAQQAERSMRKSELAGAIY